MSLPEQIIPGAVLLPEDRLITRMRQLLSDPAHPVLTAALGIVREGKVLFSEAVGSKQLGGESASAQTKYRIASISKLVTAVGVWQLIEQGLIDPEADVSGYLGFALRNPHYPDTPITVKMLLSHTSSIRDGGIPGSYNIPAGHAISEFFTPGMPCYNPNGWAPAGQAPGVYFAYCNMNYCLLGTVIERVSGERFDRYMKHHIFVPMGLSCSFHVADMPEDVQARWLPFTVSMTLPENSILTTATGCLSAMISPAAIPTRIIPGMSSAPTAPCSVLWAACGSASGSCARSC